MQNIQLSTDTFQFAVSQAADILRGGGIVLHPTETCYGFAVDVCQEAAVSKLYVLKQMSLDKPSSVMVSCLEAAQRYGVFSERALKLAEKYWPGPLTLVVPQVTDVPQMYMGVSHYIGLRVPDHRFTLQLLQDYASPLITTSANLSGRVQCYSVEDVFQHIDQDSIDCVVDGGVLLDRPPSTVVRVEGDQLHVLRPGSLNV